MSHQSDLISTDILAYLKQHEQKDLLRFLTCGSVDDGKSTLIGRLLHDSRLIYEDQLAAIQNDSAKVGNAGEGEIDLALLVDGLQSEREQGITIDVAYRFFSTEKRKFIIADTPGHEQYTRNMATGASTANLAIILIDARRGVLTQTRRHSFIVNLLGIRHVIVAINKMDLVDWSAETFEQIRRDYLEFAQALDIEDIRFVPISALRGDNVVNLSDRSPWYDGQSLMQMLETVEIDQDQNLHEFRLPVQYVNRPNLDFRGFCGTIASGIVRRGDEVKVLPSGKASRVKSIVTFDGDLEEAIAGQAITLTLEDEIDISRGDLICHSGSHVETGDHLASMLVWMGEEPMQPGKRYWIKSASCTVPASFSRIRHQVDVNTLEQHAAEQLDLNGIAEVELSLEAPLPFDPYRQVKGTGSYIVIDRMTNVTVGAGMLVSKVSDSGSAVPAAYSQFELELNALVRKHFPHWGALDIS